MRTIFPELLLKNKYVLESCYQRVQEYTVLCISLETIIEFQVPRNRNPHGVLGSREGNPELTPLWCAWLDAFHLIFFDFFYVISILFGPSIKILPILPTVFFWHKQNLPIAQKILVAPLFILTREIQKRYASIRNFNRLIVFLFIYKITLKKCAFFSF